MAAAEGTHIHMGRMQQVLDTIGMCVGDNLNFYYFYEEAGGGSAEVIFSYLIDMVFEVLFCRNPN